MRKRTLGRLLGAVLSLTMVITSVVPSAAAGIDTTDVSFFAQNEENAEETEGFSLEEDASEEVVEKVAEEGAETIEAELTDEEGVPEDDETGEAEEIAEEPGESEEIAEEPGSEEGGEAASAEADEEVTEVEDEELLKNKDPMFGETMFILDANGGTFPDGSMRYEAPVNQYKYLSDGCYIPVKEGEVFDGWYAEPACNNRLSSDSNIFALKDRPEENAVVYAKYADSWKVTLVYGNQDGTDPLSDLGYYYDWYKYERAKSMVLQGPVGSSMASGLKADQLLLGRTHNIRNEDPAYSFSGIWYRDEERQDPVENIEDYIPVGGDDVFYAGYEQNKHVITVHAGEGGYFTQRVYTSEEYPKEHVEYSEYYIPFYISSSGKYTLHKTTVTDYLENHDEEKTVAGLYLDPDFENPIELADEVDPAFTLESDETDIYIKWAAPCYVTFHAGEGAHLHYRLPEEMGFEDIPEIEIKNTGADYYYYGYVVSSDLHRAFIGWSTDPDATEPEFETTYNDYIYLSDIDPNENYDFYAVWMDDVYFVVTLDATEEGYMEYSEYGERKKERYWYLQTPKASGYFGPSNYQATYKGSSKLFSQWLVNGKGVGRTYSYTIEEDTTFVASYAVPYKVSFYADASRGGYFLVDEGTRRVDHVDKYATETVGALVPSVFNDGDYTFDAWYEDEDYTIRSSITYNFYPKKDTVYYAKWLKMCIVTFDPGEGTLEGQATYRRPEGRRVAESWFDPPIAHPASEDQMFVAWYTDANFSEDSRVRTSDVGYYTVSEGLTFYAKYAKACNVTFDLGEGGEFVSKENPYTVQIPEDEALGLFAPTVKELPGKAFLGWFDSPDENANKITNLYELKASEGSTTLYGKYSDDVYTVTFDANMEGATLDDGGEKTVSYTVAKGKAFGRDFGSTIYSMAPGLETVPESTDKVPLKEGSKLAWSIEGDTSGDLYYFNYTYVMRVDSEGEAYQLSYGTFIPTKDTTFLLNWVDEITITYLTDDDHLFFESLKDNPDYDGLSEDRKELYLKVPAGCRFGEMDRPSKYSVENHSSDQNCYFTFDENGKEIPDSTKVFSDLTVTSQWTEGSGGGIIVYEHEVTLVAGEGHFEGVTSGTKTWTARYNGRGEMMFTQLPGINDPDRAFLTWCTDPELENPYPGGISYVGGAWCIETISDMPERLYAKYGPTATIRVDANGGYFDYSVYSKDADPDEEMRSYTYFELKPSVSGEGVSLFDCSASIRYDGNAVFGGWVDAEGNPLELTSNDYRTEIFVPTKENCNAIAVWTVPGSVKTLTLSNDDLTLTVGDEPVNLGLVESPAGSTDNQNLTWKVQPYPYYGAESSYDDLPLIVSVSSDGTVTALSEGTVKIWAECCGVISNAATVTVTEPKAEAPVATPGKEGETVDITKDAVIKLSSQTEGVTILYSLDGYAPGTALDDNGEPVDPYTKRYAGAIDLFDIDEKFIIDDLLTIKAVAVKEGLKPSAVKTYKYNVTTDDWGDISSDPEFLEFAKTFFKNDPDKIPGGVWYAWKADNDGTYVYLNNDDTVEKEYNGEKITFNDEIIVYHNTRKLIEKRDYTITYANNKKAAQTTAAKAPAFTIKGKGMYSESSVFKFNINAVDMSESESVALTSEQAVAVFAGKSVKLSSTKPQLSFNGATLKEKTDYTLKYFKVVEDTETEVADPAKEILSEDILTDGKATYRIKAYGAGNFTGEFRTVVDVLVIKKDKNTVQVTALKVTDKDGKAIAFNYEKGRVIDPEDLEALFANGDAVVKNGKVALVYGRDYTVEPVPGYDYTSAGKHNFLIKGVVKNPEYMTEGENIYVGTMTASLEIKAKADISKVKVAGLLTTVEYLARNYTNDDLNSGGALFNAADKNLQPGWNKATLYTVSGKTITPLEEGEDYEVEAFSAVAVGKFKIVFKGKNGCTGTLKKTITIKTANFKKKNFTIKVKTQKFCKAGVKPDVEVKLEYYKGYSVHLRQGIDYKVTYKNNAKVFDIEGKTEKELKSAPTVTIKGMGNYTGTGASKAFTIEHGDLSQIEVYVDDVVHDSKTNGKDIQKKKPELKDGGKKLTIGKGKDIEAFDVKSCKFTYPDGAELGDGTVKTEGAAVEDKDIILADTTIQVEVPVKIPGNSPYNETGSEMETTLVGTFRVVKTSFKKAKVNVSVTDNSKLVVRNGEPIMLEEDDLEVKIGSQTLTTEDFEIVSITDNRFVGKMKLVLKGRGPNYGGTKTVKLGIKTASLDD